MQGASRLHPFCRLWGNSFSSFFQLIEAAHLPWARDPFILKAITGRLSLSPVNHSDTDISSFSLPSFKDTCDYIGSAWIMQDTLILRSTLNFICNLTFPLPCDITYSQILETRTRTCLVGNNFACHSNTCHPSLQWNSDWKWLRIIFFGGRT